jgi:hypothetical protein
MKENIIVRHYYVLQDNITVLPMVGGNDEKQRDVSCN